MGSRCEPERQKIDIERNHERGAICVFLTFEVEKRNKRKYTERKTNQEKKKGR